MITVIGGYGQGLTMRVPAAPMDGETVTGGVLSRDHGGKGSNQAVAARRLGVASRIVTALGRDDVAESARALWRAEGVDDAAMVIDDASTMTGFIIVDPSGENRICIADGALTALSPEHVNASMGALDPSDIVLVSLEIPGAAAARALHLARHLGARTILNPAPVAADTHELLVHVDILTPNRGELGVLAATSTPQSFSEVNDACRALRQRTGYSGAIVVTLGADGVFVDTGESRSHIEPVRVPVVDTTGAGDTFSAALAVSLHEGAELLDAARFAAAAGALAVTQEQVIPALPTRAAVERFMSLGGNPA